MFITLDKKTLKIALVIILCLALSISSFFIYKEVVRSANANGIVIVVDAGHGGTDTGVSGRNTGIHESEINLAIAKMLQDLLKQHGFTVVMTRDTSAGLYDEFRPGFKMQDMNRRKAIIENANPKAVVSVHQNSLGDRSVRGLQVFYKRECEESKKLSQLTRESAQTLIPHTKDRIPSIDAYVLEAAPNAAGIVVECGFLTNPEDELLLSTREHQQKIAYAIFVGLVMYFSS